MELKAMVAKVLPLVSGNGRNGEWKKQSVIVSFMSGKYQNILELTNMRNAEAFGSLRVGSEYIFHFDVSSRIYNDRYFTSCTCYKWEPVQPNIGTTAPQPAPQTGATGGFNVPQQPQQQPQAQEDDELPF